MKREAIEERMNQMRELTSEEMQVVLGGQGKASGGDGEAYRAFYID